MRYTRSVRAGNPKGTVMLGVPTYGFSPLRLEPDERFLERFHGVDERVGLDALRWWQEYKKTGDFAVLRKIAEYCAYDVKVTKCVHEYAMEHGHVKYEDRGGHLQQVEVDWK